MGSKLDRVIVVGTTGSGKSTFARGLPRVLESPYVELDALFWNPNWEPTPEEEFRRRVESALGSPRWVADGNYSRLRELIWGRATSLIWLDYPFHVSFGRLVRRTLRRIWTGEEICNGNRESFAETFFSRKSVLLWALQSAPAYSTEYPRALDLEYPHLAVQALPSIERDRALSERAQAACLTRPCS